MSAIDRIAEVATWLLFLAVGIRQPLHLIDPPKETS